MIGQAEIVVRAHIKDAFSARHQNMGILRAGDGALGFVKALRSNFIQRLAKLLFKFGEHKNWQITRIPIRKIGWSKEKNRIRKWKMEVPQGVRSLKSQSARQIHRYFVRVFAFINGRNRLEKIS